ncbi:MAG: hypothetical protein IKE70_01225 [Bacilli bacterium]|nr:hypothetical protein [Bacilli bacterium]
MSENATVSSVDVNVTYSQMEEMINNLKKSVALLKYSWDGQIKSCINRLNASWVGNDCKEYSEKLTNMNTKVHNTISALELLCSTYEQARDVIKETQNTAMTSISNLQ